MTHLTLAAVVANPTMGYATRALGVAAYVALAFSVAMGTFRALPRRPLRRHAWVVDELHQFVASLAVLLVIGHLAALLLDTSRHYTVVNLVFPLTEPGHLAAGRLGAVGLYAIAVTILSSWLRRHLNYGFWRGLHYASFVAFVAVTLHGLLAGSDTGEPWMRAVYAASAIVVVLLVGARLVMTVVARAHRDVAPTPRQTPESGRGPQARETAVHGSR
ncbi:MAG TPA: ferric reductase-like transmembrane domain-containing protein [Ktedonobacterales bacterium]|jgi:predicted ferric reductase